MQLTSSTFDLKFSVLIYFAFIFFTVIGTLSHEFGHFTVGRFLGYESVIHYSSTSWGDNKLTTDISAILKKNQEAIKLNLNFPEKQKFDLLVEKNRKNRFYTIIGGPIQTILTGTIGFLLLLWIKFKKKRFITFFSDWVYLFLTLFWLRQPTNLIYGLIINGLNKKYGRADESRISYYLNLPKDTIILITGTIGFLISGYAIINFIPKDKILNFCVVGILGGISGYILWLKILGPIVLP